MGCERQSTQGVINAMMEYKGYVARVDCDGENQTLYGEIIGIRDVITFEAESAADAQAIRKIGRRVP